MPPTDPTRIAGRRVPSVRGCARLAVALAAVLLALLQQAPGARAASFQVSPTRFEFSLEQRFTNFFTVTNNASTTLRIRIYTGFVAVDEEGQMQNVEGDPYDLSDYVVINPRRISLQPSQKRVVRFSVRPPAGLEPGEYRAVIFFEELPSAPDPAAEQEPSQGGVGFRIDLLTRLGITIYGRIGKPAPALALAEATVDADGRQIAVAGTLRNPGNAHVQAAIEASLADSSGSVVQSVTHNTVLQREQERHFGLSLRAPAAGSYTLRLVGRDKRGQPVYFEQVYPVDAE